MQGMDSVCVRAFGEALEVIPYTLAENAGLQAIAIVTELRNRCAWAAHRLQRLAHTLRRPCLQHVQCSSLIGQVCLPSLLLVCKASMQACPKQRAHCSLLLAGMRKAARLLAST